jgi:hypothetical protein
VADLDVLALELSTTERDAVTHLLERTAEAVERHADRLGRDTNTNAP